MKQDEEKYKEEAARSRMLFFRVGGELFALHIAFVEVIVVDPDITPVPLAPSVVVGVVNYRGRIFTVVDFAGLAGLGEGPAQGAVVFLYRSDMSVGFTVSAVDAIDWVPDRLVEEAAPAMAGERSTFLKGLLDFKGRMANVVAVEQLVDAIVRLPDANPEKASATGSERRSVNGN